MVGEPTEARSKKEVVTEFRCAGILDAAERVFAERGFEAARVEEIARLAGIAKGTVYLYYRSKRQLYGAALRRCLSELSERTREAVDEVSSLEEKLAAFVRTKLRYFEEHRDFLRIYFTEFGHLTVRPARAQGDLEELFLGQARLLAAAFRGAIAEGRLRPLPAEAAAFAVYAVTRDLIVQRARGWSTGSLDGDVAFVCDLLLKGMACA